MKVCNKSSSVVNNYHYVSLLTKILALELREPVDEQLCKVVNNIYIHNINTLDEEIIQLYTTGTALHNMEAHLVYQWHQYYSYYRNPIIQDSETKGIPICIQTFRTSSM